MKIEQKKVVFKPISITLESPEEAQAFWDICENVNSKVEISNEMKKLAVEISNDFCNRAGIKA